jgi:lipopolysaccharide transport system permease protein
MGASSSGTTNFALYLFSGMMPWLAFSDAVSRSAGIIIENSHIIKKMVFPVAILPVYVTISCVVLELISLGIFILAIYFITHSISWLIILLPLIIAIQLMLTLGFAWLFATLNVFIRDIGQLLSLLLTAWMFLTPIFYPASMVPDRFRLMLQINPFYYIVESYRDLLLNQRFPDPKGLVIAAGMALLSYLFGYWFFSRAKDAFIDVI